MRVPGVTRAAHGERHAKRRFVYEVAVHVFAVLAQCFAVIRRHDDEGVVQLARLPQGRDDPPHQLVAPRNLTIVGPPARGGAYGSGGV